MELTCPNCGARYRVAADAIPPEGRTVRCPHCDHSWFETGAAHIANEDAFEPPVVETALPPAPEDLIGHSGAVEPAGAMAVAHEVDASGVEAELAVRAELEREGAPQPPPLHAPARVYAEANEPARGSGGLGTLTWVLIAVVLLLAGVIAWGLMTGRMAL